MQGDLTNMRSPLSTYGFLNAKLKTRLSKHLSKDFLDKLIRSRSLPEAIQLLKGTDYEEILKVYSDTGDLAMAEARMNERALKLHTDLYRFLKEPVLSFVKALSIRFEIEQLKSAIRLWFDASVRGRSITGKSSYLYHGHIVNSYNVDAIVRAKDTDGLFVALDGTPYLAIAREEIPLAVTKRSLYRFELALDRFFYKEALEATLKLSPTDKTIAMRILLADVDAQNESRLLRNEKLSSEDIKAESFLFIPYGSVYTKLVKQEFKNSSSNIVPNEAMAQSSELETAGRRALSKEADRSLGAYPFTIGTVLAYFVKRQEEFRIVMTTLNAKYYSLPEERVRRFL